MSHCHSNTFLSQIPVTTTIPISTMTNKIGMSAGFVIRKLLIKIASAAFRQLSQFTEIMEMDTRYFRFVFSLSVAKTILVHVIDILQKYIPYYSYLFKIIVSNIDDYRCN